MIVRSIGQTTAYLVAAPDYLDGRSPLVHPRDLEQHDCIVYHRWGREDVWWFSGPRTNSEHTEGEIAVTVHGRLRANNAGAVYRAVLDGRGIALMSHLLVTDDIRTGRLRHLLPEFPSRRFPLYVIYPSKRGLPPRTRAAIEYLTELLDKDPDMALGGVARRPR